jgi:hypothetical protein
VPAAFAFLKYKIIGLEDRLQPSLGDKYGNEVARLVQVVHLGAVPSCCVATSVDLEVAPDGHRLSVNEPLMVKFLSAQRIVCEPVRRLEREHLRAVGAAVRRGDVHPRRRRCDGERQVPPGSQEGSPRNNPRRVPNKMIIPCSR